MTPDEVVALLDQAGIASARLRTPAEFAAHPQLVPRWREVDTPAGPVRALLPPVTVPGREAAMGAVPALGQHTDEVLDEILEEDTMTTLETTERPQYQLVIDGRRVEAASGQRYDTVDPYLGAPWASAADGDTADVDAAVAAARRALAGPWGQLTGFGRARLMRRLADLIARDAGRLAEIETRDTGKLLREMRGQLGTHPGVVLLLLRAGRQARRLDHPGRQAELPRLHPARAGRRGRGDRAVELPAAAAVLEAGAGAGRGLHDGGQAERLLPRLRGRAGRADGRGRVPAGGVQRGDRVRARGRQGAGRPPRHRQGGVHRLDRVGAEVAKAAAANITGVLLELGGKSAHLVFDDADLDAACNGVLAGVFAATGQTCMAGSRLLVSRTVHDALVDKIAERARAIRLGDPRAAETEMGPVATEPQYRKVLSFLDSAATEGATIAAGGRADDALGGFFVQPTVLTGVKPTMTVACEEVFGPVLAVIGFDTEDEAVALANDSRYGLAGAVWTKDIHRGHRVAHALRTGTVWINAYRVVGPDVPFGGFGLSGLGRENGIDAVHEYTQTKAVWVELTGGTRDPFTLG